MPSSQPELLSFFHPVSVGLLNLGFSLSGIFAVTVFSIRCNTMSYTESRIVCLRVCGVTPNCLSVFLAASKRNRADSDTSSMCVAVTLAPLERRVCFITLNIVN